jgi:hypothetical protein
LVQVSSPMQIPKYAAEQGIAEEDASKQGI